MFSQDKILAEMELLRQPNGAFFAAPTEDYSFMWIRDHIYCTFSYWYLEEHYKLQQGIWLIFDLLKRYKSKLIIGCASSELANDSVLHARYYMENDEVKEFSDEWGHYQLDALGLFLYIVADCEFKNVGVIRDEEDLQILQLLVFYLRSVEYWRSPDFGMWEECRIVHSSSVGAVLGGLSYIKKQKLAVVPDALIKSGEESLEALFPQESKNYVCKIHHNHDCDSAQLSLIWPYHILNTQQSREILSRITDGHLTENGDRHNLVQINGLNRFWGDDYYRSTEGELRGVSAEWPMFKFWLSIIYSQLHEYENAKHWFSEGCKSIVNDCIAEAYQNGRPNNHTPLAWAHAIALIAFLKLPAEIQKEFSEK